VDGLAPIAVAVARVEERMSQIRSDLKGLRDAIAADRRAAKERDAEMTQELHDMRNEQVSQSRANRTTIITGAVSIITTLLIVGATIVAAGGIQ
jgi:hypothetical protein